MSVDVAKTQSATLTLGDVPVSRDMQGYTVLILKMHYQLYRIKSQAKSKLSKLLILPSPQLRL